jgi:septal ring factor EnvC (AmiA/AmiB activator)
LSVYTDKKSEVAQIVEISRAERDALLLELSSSGFAIRKIENDIVTLEQRLKQFETEEQKRRAFVASKHAVYVEIIAAMQRIGLNPPPAMLVSPLDAINAVRSATILDHVMPNMRAEATVLVENLDRLVLLRQTISSDRTRLALELTNLVQARTKIAALVEDKKKIETQSTAELAAIQSRVALLAKQSESLKEQGVESRIYSNFLRMIHYIQ